MCSVYSAKQPSCFSSDDVEITLANIGTQKDDEMSEMGVRALSKLSSLATKYRWLLEKIGNKQKIIAPWLDCAVPAVFK